MTLAHAFALCYNPNLASGRIPNRSLTNLFSLKCCVIPAQSGIWRRVEWIPAEAGMTRPFGCCIYHCSGRSSTVPTP